MKKTFISPKINLNEKDLSYKIKLFGLSKIQGKKNNSQQPNTTNQNNYLTQEDDYLILLENNYGIIL